MDMFKARCKLPLSESLNYFSYSVAGEVLDFKNKVSFLESGWACHSSRQ